MGASCTTPPVRLTYPRVSHGTKTALFQFTLHLGLSLLAFLFLDELQQDTLSFGIIFGLFLGFQLGLVIQFTLLFGLSIPLKLLPDLITNSCVSDRLSLLVLTTVAFSCLTIIR